MRYCKKCGNVIDEFARARDKQNCPICSWVWSEDDMTALKYAELSEEEKDAYDEQLLMTIRSNPKFDEQSFNNNGNSTKDGGFWAGFRPEKWKKICLQNSDIPEWQIDDTIANRKKREPFKPFPEIDIVKAREVAEHSELMYKAHDMEYFDKLKPKNVPKCPICQSANLSKISNVKKATMVGLFGIFGAGDIGKTWKCNNCGSKF